MAEPTLLRVLLVEKHWQRWSTFEAQFRRAAVVLAERDGQPSLARTPVSERQFERWYAGRLRTLPRPDACRVLEHMFGYPAAELIAPPKHSPDTSAQDEGTRDDLVAEVADESAELGEWAAVSEIADATIERHSVQVRRLARDHDFGAPLVPLLLRTRQLRDRVRQLLRMHARPDQVRDLYLLAAQTCGLLAWQTADLGDYQAASTHVWAARICAEQAGHDGASAWVFATEAKLAYWDGQWTESAELAEEGLRYRTTDSARVMLGLFRARALARAGRPGEAKQALSQAVMDLDRVTGPDLLGGIWAMPMTRYHGIAGNTLMLLNRPADALDHAQEVIALAAGAPDGERHLLPLAHACLDSAIAWLGQAELDGGVTALRDVFALPSHIRNDPLLKHLTRVQGLLNLPRYTGSQLARDAQDEIREYQRQALPQPPAIGQ